MKLEAGQKIYLLSGMAIIERTVDKVGRRWAHIAKVFPSDADRISLVDESDWRVGEVVGGRGENVHAWGFAFLTKDAAKLHLRRRAAWENLKSQARQLRYSVDPPANASTNWLEQTARVMAGLKE